MEFIYYIKERKNYFITVIFLFLLVAILLKNVTPSRAQFMKTGVVNILGELNSSGE